MSLVRLVPAERSTPLDLAHHGALPRPAGKLTVTVNLPNSPENEKGARRARNPRVRPIALRRGLENLTPAQKTLAKRWHKGVFDRCRRSGEAAITDVRGPVVRSVGIPQTFLTAAQVAKLVAAYGEGLTLAELGERFGIHHRTARAHLARQKVPLRTRGLDAKHVPEAVRLYEGGTSLMEIGLRFGASQNAVRRALAAQDVTIRSRGGSRSGSRRRRRTAS